MKFHYAIKHMTNYQYQRNVLLGLCSILLILLLLISLSLFMKSERIIVLPPEVRQEFWVEGNRFSPEYLEEMAVYFLHLSLDVNQNTLPYNTEILMRYADSGAANYLREKFERDLSKLKQNDAATSFAVKEVNVFSDKNIVRVTGILYRYFGTKIIREEEETYEVQLKTYRGRLFFNHIKKLNKRSEDSN